MTDQERYDQLANKVLLHHLLSQEIDQDYRELAEIGSRLYGEGALPAV